MYVRACVRTCVRAYVRACVRTCVRVWARACVRACVRTCARAFEREVLHVPGALEPKRAGQGARARNDVSVRLLVSLLVHVCARV